MPRIRSIHQIISGPVLAIEQRGMDRLLAQTMSHLGQGPVQQMLAHADSESSVMPEEANSWREFIKSTGLYPYYVNPTGQIVHTLDENYENAIQPGAVAIMPVSGVLVREAWSYEEIFWGLVSADRLTKFIRSVTIDDRVAGLVSTVNCPGGMVSGTEKLGRTFAKLTAAKQTVLHVDDLAASAAYWFGCHASTIQLDGHTADVGSVGVMMSYLDFIPWMEKMGAVYHELYAVESEKKNEDWRSLRERRDPKLIQESLGVTARIFRSVVTTARPGLAGNDDVLQGVVLSGEQAITAGLADGFADIDACIDLVRTGTQTENAPPTTDPTSQVPPTVDDGNDNAKTLTPMSLKTKLAALVAGLFSTKEEITADSITAANAELQQNEDTKELVIMTAAESARLNEHAAAIADAERKAADAEAEKNSAVIARANADEAKATAQQALETANARIQAIDAELAAAKTEHELEVPEGTTVAAALSAALKATKASQAEAQKEIAELKQEDSPTAGPKTPVGAQGGDPNENQEKSTAWQQL